MSNSNINAGLINKLLEEITTNQNFRLNILKKGEFYKLYYKSYLGDRIHDYETNYRIS